MVNRLGEPEDSTTTYVGQGAKVSGKWGYFLRDPAFRAPLRAPAFRLRGTLPPSLRASLRPIAIACFRLVTFRPERPDFSVPCFRSCIARLTLLCAFFPYLAMHTPLRAAILAQGICPRASSIARLHACERVAKSVPLRSSWGVEEKRCVQR